MALLKIGNAEIISIVNPEETKDDNKRKEALAKALESAEDANDNSKETTKITER